MSVQFRKTEKVNLDALSKLINLSTSEIVRRATLLYVRAKMEQYGILPEEQKE